MESVLVLRILELCNVLVIKGLSTLKDKLFDLRK